MKINPKKKTFWKFGIQNKTRYNHNLKSLDVPYYKAKFTTIKLSAKTTYKANSIQKSNQMIIKC